MTMIKGRRAGMVTVALMLAVMTGCVRVVREDPPAPLPDGELAVRLVILEGPGGGTMALVPVMIAGQGPFTFALDTGASHSLVDREIAEQLNLSVGETPIEVTGVGAVSEAQPVELSQWSLGDEDSNGHVPLPPRTLVTMELAAGSRGLKLQGLLGSDVLSEFDQIRVDYRGQMLTLHPRQRGEQLAPMGDGM
jgi:hypothetical protein